jgi:CRP/FNR family transcriptional regulator
MVLPGLDPVTRQAVLAQSASVAMDAGSVLFRPGDLCTQFFVLLSGNVRVHRLARSGREMVLYHVRAGETCILTTLCLLSAETYSAGAVVEEDVSALALPSARFNALLDQSAGFRRLVFTSYAQRMADLMQRIEELSDVPVDVRLAACLLERAEDGSTIQATHQGLATEIGTAREVVSRALGRLEQLGVLHLARGQIAILDRPQLTHLARSL